MNSPGQPLDASLEPLCAELAALQARVRQSATTVLALLRDGRSPAGALAELADLVAQAGRQQAGLQRHRERGLKPSVESERLLDDTRALLAETIDLLQSAETKATAELRVLAEQLDGVILEQKRRRAYRASAGR
jgi:hypothetical protein